MAARKPPPNRFGCPECGADRVSAKAMTGCANLVRSYLCGTKITTWAWGQVQRVRGHQCRLTTAGALPRRTFNKHGGYELEIEDE